MLFVLLLFLFLFVYLSVQFLFKSLMREKQNTIKTIVFSCDCTKKKIWLNFLFLRKSVLLFCVPGCTRCKKKKKKKKCSLPSSKQKKKIYTSSDFYCIYFIIIIIYVLQKLFSCERSSSTFG